MSSIDSILSCFESNMREVLYYGPLRIDGISTPRIWERISRVNETTYWVIKVVQNAEIKAKMLKNECVKYETCLLGNLHLLHKQLCHFYTTEDARLVNAK